MNPSEHPHLRLVRLGCTCEILPNRYQEVGSLQGTMMLTPAFLFLAPGCDGKSPSVQERSCRCQTTMELPYRVIPAVAYCEAALYGDSNSSVGPQLELTMSGSDVLKEKRADITETSHTLL